MRVQRIQIVLSTALAAAALTAGGCRGERLQSALHPASPAASAVANLWWVLLAICGIYTLAVFVLMGVAIFRRSDEDHPPPYGGRVFITVGGILLPALILVPLLFYSLTTTAALRLPETGLTIRVVGHRWWWHVEYPEQGIVTANELYIPAGEPVHLELTSADVIHSFWVPQLHGKMDLLPGQLTQFWVQADRPGTYRGQCAEFCGLQHAHMAFVVEALPPEEFAAWIDQRQSPPQAEGAAALRGREAFFRNGCAVCHAIRGTRAAGTAGPDLTHMGSRQTIGAATVPNTPEHLRDWVANPQTIKPGVNMPPTHAAEEDIQAIVDYLQSLK